MALDSYATAGKYADRIELELRRIGQWQDGSLPESAFESRAAFCADTMTFFQWLQFVLLNRIRTTVTGKGTFPARSQVGAYAVRELDGFDGAEKLITLLGDFDAFIESLATTVVDAPGVARRYLESARSSVRDAAGGADPVDTAHYTAGLPIAAPNGWDVPCHALIRYRSAHIVERRFALRVVWNDGVLKVDLDDSLNATRAYLSQLIVATNERASEAGRDGDLARMKLLLAESENLCRQADLELRGLGLDAGPNGIVLHARTEPAQPESIPPPPTDPETPDGEILRARAAAFWKARVAGDPAAASYEVDVPPSTGTGFDVSRAEQVWDSAIAFLETVGDTEEVGGGVAVRTLIDTLRGPMLVLTVLRLENLRWRVDRVLSLNATTRFWLGLHGNRHPFGDEESSRSVAMSFWYGVQMRWFPQVYEYVTPESRNRAIPAIGSGQVDEFFFYLDDHAAATADEAFVRVMINTHDLVRIVHTPMISREGEWLVDLSRVLRQLPEPEV
jgi:uncharacterized protein YqcC (DUF446 family)